MLTSIEITGFKSFADKARIDFSEGISVIVGPNGSGKSNIVDAIKWVLGEQSVKKLRGSEMTDVIFGGSKTRSPANMAEVTLTFNNESRFFDLDTDELNITRRLYRNGESEYLINRQGVRLKDVRDLLTGSGLGAQAYSIIEQGRVALLLQSTSAQRRAILEDAAGTSLFNAKSQEALRRLERVEQNLLRLSDIVGEVENQYKQTQKQAGKAQQYSQYAARLMTLRTQVALVQWSRDKQRVEELDSQVGKLFERRGKLEETVRSAELIRKKCVNRLSQMENELRRVESELGDAREKAAGGQSIVFLQTSQIDQLEKEIGEQGAKFDEIKLQSGDAEESIQRTADEMLQARRRHREIKADFDAQSGELARLTAECDELRAGLDESRKKLEDDKVQRSRLAGEISGLEVRFNALQDRTAEKENRHRELVGNLSASSETDNRLKGKLQESDDRIDILRRQVEEIKIERDKAASYLERLRVDMREKEHRRAVESERLSLLLELVKSQEGLGPGVKEVLYQAQNASSPFRNVHGLVADLIRVSSEAAPLIEAALGQTAQFLVVSPDPELFSYLENNLSEFPGRAGFIWLSPSPEDDWKGPGEFDDLPGVLGRADRFVETEPKFQYLVYRLLGRTWLVEDLKIAKALYSRSDGLTDFITVNGEALLSSGTLLVGPSHLSDGQIMRRSEIRTLSEHTVLLDGEISKKEKQIVEASVTIDRLNKELTSHENDLRNLQNDADNLRLQCEAHRLQDENSQKEFQRLNEELKSLAIEGKQIATELESARTHKRELDERTAQIEQTIELARGKYNRSDNFRKDASRKVNNLEIELAKSEERMNALSDRQRQLNESLRERRKLLSEHAQQLETLRKRREKSEITVLEAESTVAAQVWRKEKMIEHRNTLTTRKENDTSQLNEIDEELNQNRTFLSKVSEAIRLNEIEVKHLEEGMKNLADTMREDYGIDLPAKAMLRPGSVASLSGGPEQNRDISQETSDTSLEECLKEIESLKKKIDRLGSVNLEALESLEVLQTRYTTYANQHKDLLSARQSIQRIIDRTNKERQKLFRKTFEAVRIHFLNIFQQLFGGGHSDVVLEDPDKPMESGIDIVARPPGKELKNVALLSGGEKTLTSVAFLLALFRYRSSPICLLDEVDAALDEINVERFNAVMRSFDADTQFIIITHSKKTMMVAKTLYGVTMQDSGVSKLIAVQFDEVGEDGEILIKDSEKRAAA
ncbi:MAG: chromosome segregation protein SMC [Thermoguttaceae bacterium]|jgi:chromosome segregation protein